MRQVVEPVDGEQTDQVPTEGAQSTGHVSDEQRRYEADHSHQQVDYPQHLGETLDYRHSLLLSVVVVAVHTESVLGRITITTPKEIGR